MIFRRDAIRGILRTADEPLTSAEIAQKLEDLGDSASGCTSLKCLTRTALWVLKCAGEVRSVTDRSWRTKYIWQWGPTPIYPDQGNGPLPQLGK